MMVRAKKFEFGGGGRRVMGWMYGVRIREGEVFELEDEKQFSPKWMEKVESAPSAENVIKKPVDKKPKVFKSQEVEAL